MNKKIIYIFLLAGMFSGCSIYKTMMNISRLKFKLDNVSNFKLNGIDISDKTSLKDFGAMQLIQLTASFAKGELPVSFTVNVEAKNPNDGSGGFPATDLTIIDFPWKLMINGKETVSGDISDPVRVPGVGQKKIIPVGVELDLMKVLKSGGFNDIINMVFSLGGKKSNPASLKIIASPVLDTPIGEMKYPEPITIVSEKFN